MKYDYDPCALLKSHDGDMSDPAYRDYFEKRNALLREWTCSSERAEVLEKIEQLKNGECYE